MHPTTGHDPRTFVHLSQNLLVSERVNVQHRGHLVRLAGLTLMPSCLSDSMPWSEEINMLQDNFCLPGIESEDVYTHSGDEVPRSCSVTSVASETMNNVFK